MFGATKAQGQKQVYSLHETEVECIGKGKATRPYEFGVKASFAIIHKKGLIVGVRTFPGNPFDGHTLAEQLEQTQIWKSSTKASTARWPRQTESGWEEGKQWSQ